MKHLLFLSIFTLLFSGLTVAQERSSVFASKNPSMLYLGGVLKKNSLNQDEHNVLNLIDDDITMSFDGASVRSVTLKAGKDNMYRSLEEAFSKASSPVFQNNTSFSYNLQEIKQYSAVENDLGQTLNLREWFGISPEAKTPKTLLAVDIKRTAFTAYLDLPPEGSFATDPEEIAKYDPEDLIYVNSLSFGRRILMLVESNLDKNTVNTTLKNVLEGEQLSDHDKAVLANCTFRTVVFGNEEIPISPAPFEQILDYIDEELTKDNYGMPISFSAACLTDNSVFENTY
ncbi:thiol-activated cytolysin family protein [Sphingobacterium gobiense]|uniref:Uncharacterized protein n=1 Tax=Sphingobacterium gobiense TaxID=1382456 RepID=A0A2S9JUU6_9SPHI|nr:thiol-activated cytolysin family protein [Sphingobacterium gobiense]PRD57057.1 hypothetical protein C5749_07580 [Sphingobacterium gobiense]